MYKLILMYLCAFIDIYSVFSNNAWVMGHIKHNVGSLRIYSVRCMNLPCIVHMRENR